MRLQIKNVSTGQIYLNLIGLIGVGKTAEYQGTRSELQAVNPELSEYLTKGYVKITEINSDILGELLVDVTADKLVVTEVFDVREYRFVSGVVVNSSDTHIVTVYPQISWNGSSNWADYINYDGLATIATEEVRPFSFDVSGVNYLRFSADAEGDVVGVTLNIMGGQ